MKDLESIKVSNDLAVIDHNIDKIFKALEENNGVTLNKDFKVITFAHGYQVSIKDYYKVLYDGLFKSTLKALLLNCMRYDLYNKTYLGLWYDKKEGYLYIDNSVHVKTIETALEIAKAHNQKSIYSWHGNSVHYLEDYKDFI